MSAPPNTLLLVFRLQAREYALPVASVVEVLRMVAVSPLPGSPAWLSGVINLRGHIIPVMDLRLRMGLAAEPIDLTTPLIIAESNGQTLGLVVDSAVEVLSAAQDA